MFAKVGQDSVEMVPNPGKAREHIAESGVDLVEVAAQLAVVGPKLVGVGMDLAQA